MKAYVALAFLLLPVCSQAKVYFQALTQNSSSHELSWNFSEPVKNWGSVSPKTVSISCSGKDIEQPGKVIWANSQLLKLIPAKNFNPGDSCEVTLNLKDIKQVDKFQIALANIIESRPYNFDKLAEDSSFVLAFDAKVDDDLIATIAYIEVEGLREKIEFDAVKGDLKKEVLVKSSLGMNANAVVLKARRTFPYDKKIVLVVPQKYTTAFEQQGKIREDFKLQMNCDRPNLESPCSPVSKIKLNFTDDIDKELAKKITLNQGKNSWKLDLTDYSYLSWAQFPATLLPDTEYTIKIDGEIKDIDGRRLSNEKKFPLTFRTGPYPPLAKFPGPFGILEANADPVIPVSVRNIEKKVTLKKNSVVLSLNNPKIFIEWLSTIEKRQDVGYETVDLRGVSIFTKSPMALKEEIIEYRAGKNEVEVLGLPVKKKGLHLVELSSPSLAKSLLEKSQQFFISSAVLVTNLSAHLKIGDQESLVWVTTLDKGEVVAGAEVQIFDCKANLIEKAVTGPKGFTTFHKVNHQSTNCTNGIDKLHRNVLVVAKKADDATFTLSSWDEGIESWRFGLPYYDYEPLVNQKAHTVFDRPLYKVTEKVHMLHLLRSLGNEGVVLSKANFTHLQVTHVDTNKDWFVPIKWKDLGSAISEFVVPEFAPQGVYNVALVNLNKKKEVATSVNAGMFMVKDFRVPLMRSEVHFQDNKERYSSKEPMKVLGHLDFLAGGVASFTPVTLRGELNQAYSFHLKEYPNYVFDFSDFDVKYEGSTKILEKKVVRTDKNGDFSFEMTSIPQSTKVQNLVVEIEYLDPNGIYQTNSTHTSIFPYETIIGIKKPESISEKKPSEFLVQTLDLKHKPQKNISFKGTLYKQVTTSSRKKIIGGFYTYDSSTKQIKLNEACTGKTNNSGEARCKVAGLETGYYRLVIEGNDSRGTVSFSVYGESFSWVAQEYNDRVDLVPERKSYHPGDTAKIEMKLPFDTATVLVTKERIGIKDTYLMPYDRTNPFITIPIEKNDFPNFFISALAVRGRIGTPAPTGLVDLAKPAYKIGIKEIRVDRNDSNLKIELFPDKEKYQVREKVRLKVKVSTLDGTPLDQTKIVLSVFDEGLLLLNGQNSFDAAKTLIQSYPHGVRTSTAQTHIIGKRHFGLKAKPHGGGGGKDLKPRELFETLVYWNPSVALDKKGEASVEFTLNDSLTSFKIYGLAYSTEKFGTSNTRIIATQDIMTFVGTSPEVRTGDEFHASYTLKNLTSQDKNLRTELFLNQRKIQEESFTVKASESHSLNSAIPAFTKNGTATYLLNIFEGPKRIDSIKTVQKISPLLTPRVQFADLKELKTPVNIKALNDPHLFGVEILLSPKLTPALKTLQDFMRNYPYSCLEQKLAKYTILEDKSLEAKLLRDLSSYTDGRGLLKFYPTADAKGSVLLTAHFLEINFFNDVKSPKDEQLESALSSFVSGSMLNIDDWEKREFPLLRLRAIAILRLRNSPFYSKSWPQLVQPATSKDSVIELLDKWIVFYQTEKAKAVFDLLQSKLKIDGAMVSLLREDHSGYNFLYSQDPTLFGKFLLLQKVLPFDADFSKFYRDNEGKFLRGYFNYRVDGSWGGTVSNTYAYLIQKLAGKNEPVSGITVVANTSSNWKKNAAPDLFLNAEIANHDQILEHKGKGTPWADVRTLTYPDKEATVSQGIELKTELQNLESHSDYQVQDRVTLKIILKVSNDVPMGAVNLPLPSGVSILDTISSLPLSFEERTESKWRGYFTYVPKGVYEILVTFRLNQIGTFEVPGARMEAMYSPDVFGETKFWNIKVK